MRSKGVGGARARQASPRALAIGGGVALVIVIAIVLAVVLGSGGGSGSGGQVVSAGDMQGLPAIGSDKSAGALAGAVDANNLFKGIPQKGLVLGNPKAKTEMEMFIDVQCPVCQDYEVNHLPGVVNKYIKTGKVQLRLQPWAFIGGAGSQSFTGRLGVIAAADQNKAFEYAKVLYDNQPANSENTGYLTGQWMAQIAASVNGLNLAQWRDDVNGSAAKATASDVDTLAAQKKVGGTPTILVGPRGGTLQVASGGSSYNPTGVDQALAAAVANP
ncbi:MAG TPA: thioredoxin domain-containing protein [Gaiellaceae bacterium]